MAANKTPEVTIDANAADAIVLNTKTDIVDADLKVLDGGTVLETQTVVEDRTDKPAIEAEREYHSEEITLDSGTILTSYGEPKAE